MVLKGLRSNSRIRKVSKTKQWTVCDTWWSIYELNLTFFLLSIGSAASSGGSSLLNSLMNNSTSGCMSNGLAQGIGKGQSFSSKFHHEMALTQKSYDPEHF